jgi:WD40 repeat protein/transcriptional regulator with XRE-family HTH domain
MDAQHGPETFRSLLPLHRGRTKLIQRELAARAGVSLRSVQDWESGVTLPTADRLQLVVRALLNAGGFTRGSEVFEARQLWAAAQRDGSRMHTPFDEQWFAALLHTDSSTPEWEQDAVQAVTASEQLERAQDWGDVPDSTHFVGRAEELALLQTWLLEERCRLVAVLGMGGIGKTSLAATTAQRVAPNFARVYWRSLRNAPPITDWLAGAIGFLSDQQMAPPTSESERITALLQLLRARRCLLVLDNSETVFEAAQQQGSYRAGMDGFGRVIHAIGETPHQSCLILTSREAPPELAVLGPGVHSLELHGLGVTETQTMVAEKHLIGDTEAWFSLVDRYGGNGLALKIVSETIRQVYDGDMAAFLGDATGMHGTVFGGIRRLLDAQVERHSPIEYDVLQRLAVEREAISLAELSTDMPRSIGRSSLVEAIDTLRRRSLVERGERGAGFTLQSMVLEYITDRLVESVANEVERRQPMVLVEHSLIKAQVKDYVRQTQERVIGEPILRQLHSLHGADSTERQLLGLLDTWRGKPAAEQRYGPGNVVNLLRLLRGNLRDMDLSRLALRHVYLQGVDAQAASLAGSHLAQPVLGQAFEYPTAVALSADGAFLTAGTTTGEVRLWRTADRTLLLATPGHTGAIWGLALAQDGRQVVSAGVDGMVKLWEAPSGRPLASWQGHTGEVRGVALARDGHLVASAGVDGDIKLWDTGSGQLLNTLQGHMDAVWGVAFSGDGRLLASGGGDGTVRLWDPSSGQLTATLRGHTGLAQGVALSGDGRLLASGGVDGLVRVWDPRTGQLLATLHGHTGAVYGVVMSDDGHLVASSSGDGTVRLWEAGTGQALATLHGHNGLVLSVALSSDGRLLASCGGDASVRLWEPASGQLVSTLQGHTNMVYGLALSGDGQMLAHGGVDGLIRSWDLTSGRPVAALHGHAGLVLGIAFSGDRRIMVSGGGDGTLRVWDASREQPLATLDAHTGFVYGVALSSDGRLAASGGVDATVRLWDTGSGRALSTLRAHTGGVRAVAFSGDGRRLASCGGDGTVRLWDTQAGELLATLAGHAGAVYGVSLSVDGALVASGGGDGTVRVWDSDSRRELATLHGHSGAVRSVALSQDGRLVASGCLDGIVRLWDAASGRLLAALRGHGGLIFAVAVSQDGRLLASGGVDGLVRLWDTANGEHVRMLRSDRCYERLDITGLTGVTEAQRAALLALGAVETPA